jgi:hypothetical protein
MSSLKIVGAIIIAVSGIVGSYVLNSAARHTLEQIEGFLSLVRHLRNEIECFCMPLPSALARCPREVLVRCGYTASDVPKSVRELVDGCVVSDGETQKAMLSFASSIGKGYRDEQLGLCDYCIELIEARRQIACEQLPSRIKRNSAVCMCGALAVVILLI